MADGAAAVAAVAVGVVVADAVAVLAAGATILSDGVLAVALASTGADAAAVGVAGVTASAPSFVFFGRCLATTVTKSESAVAVSAAAADGVVDTAATDVV